jgi:hypothetical protein
MEGAAWRLLQEIAARNEQDRAERLAAAIPAAHARGKERFDLAKLKTLCDTSTPAGDLDPDVERRRAVRRS